MKKLFYFPLLFLALNAFAQPQKIETFEFGIHTMSPVGTKLFFFSTEIFGDYEQFLNVTDGFPGHADTVVSIGPRPVYGWGTDGDLFYFYTVANDTALVWASDGTESGTAPIDTFQNLEDFGPFPRLGNSLYFHAFEFDGSYGLYKLTNGITTFIKDLNPSDQILTSYPNKTFVAGDLLFFYVIGEGLYATNGTVEGTLKVSDVNPSLAQASTIFDLNGKILFTLSDNGDITLNFTETIHTTPVTLMQLDDNTNINGYAVIGSTGYFLLDHRQSNNLYNFFELWKTDGTPGNTSLVYTFNGNGVAPLPPVGITTLGDQLAIFSSECANYNSGDDIFFCDAYDNVIMYKSDGTSAGTKKIYEFAGVIDHADDFQAINTLYGYRLYFNVDGNLYESNLEVGGTRNLGALYPEIANNVGDLVTFKGCVFFDYIPTSFTDFALFKYTAEEIVLAQHGQIENTNTGTIIAPMPVVEQAEIKIPANYTGTIELSISDLNGKNIMRINANAADGNAILNLANITNPGVYLYSCIAGTEVYWGKLVKK